MLLNAILFQFCMVVNLFFFNFWWLYLDSFRYFSGAFFFKFVSIVFPVNIVGWLPLNHFATALYCPIAITIKLVHLIPHFHWLISPWQRMDIFRYSPSSRKMVALFVNIGKREKKKPLERSRCNETIVIKPLQRSRCKVSPFFLIFNFSQFVYREKSNNSSSLCTDTAYKENNSVYLSNK